MFMTRALFDRVGGFPELELMEDVAISKRLRQVARPTLVTQRLVTSSRRWREAGVLKTIGLMWFLRLMFFIGVNPTTLARWYRFRT